MQKMDLNNDLYEQYCLSSSCFANGVEERIDNLKSLYSSEFSEATKRFPVEIYSLYIQHVLLPQIEERRQNGELKDGCCSYMMEGKSYSYYGELNKDRKPCGRGILYTCRSFTYEGTWLDGE